MEHVLRRLRSLGPDSGPPSTVNGSAVEVASTTTGPRTLREIMYDLETIVPSAPEAIVLVREWVEASGEGSDFLDAFGAVVGIIKSAGDVDLASEVADLCLKALSGDRLLRAEKEARARVLISLKAWHLRRRWRLDEARIAVEEGIRLAGECDDARLVALGEGSLGRIHRGFAEVAEPADRDRHLEDAERLTKKAVESLNAMGRHEEVGVYRTVLARIAFTQHELLHKGRYLRKAEDHADQAGRLLPPSRVRESFELQILRARIEVEHKCYEDAQGLLDKVIADLGRRGTDGASYVELLGRAHQARAELRRLWRGHDVMADVEEALSIFQGLGLEQAVAECLWFKAKVSPSGLSGFDSRILEHLCADPRLRLAAVEERKVLDARGIRRHWLLRVSEWKSILEMVRRRG